MLKSISIKSLYTLALAEGEGVGTAYEYFAKRLALAPWLRQMPPPRRVLVAGLPEKYGASLDFLQIGAECGAAVTVVDERPSALERVDEAVTAVQAQGWLARLKLQMALVDDVAALASVLRAFDLALSSEVLQRLTPESQERYVGDLGRLAPAVALFAPNADNPGHTDLSGLAGLRLPTMQALFAAAPEHMLQRSGYIDMPPFPPGVTRSESQREQASSGRFEALAMWGLGYYARLERFLPQGVRRRQSHIVYGLAQRR